MKPQRTRRKETTRALEFAMRDAALRGAGLRLVCAWEVPPGGGQRAPAGTQRGSQRLRFGPVAANVADDETDAVVVVDDVVDEVAPYSQAALTGHLADRDVQPGVKLTARLAGDPPSSTDCLGSRVKRFSGCRELRRRPADR